MASFQEEWLTVDDTIRQRGIYMFSNDLLSNVSLVVRGSSDEDPAKKTKMAIPAHKVVLAMCSPVFFAMFYGECADKSDSVDLPDCHYEGLLEMLRYMYSGRAELNENNAMQVLYVAKKYMVKSLSAECIEFLQMILSPDNVFCVLSHAEQYDEKVLVDQCWEMIDSYTELVVTAEEFVTIERSLLEVIIKRDTLTIKEVELFKAVDLWATKECERQGLPADGNTKRRILGDTIVEQIRFPVMEENEFAGAVLDSEILTQQELVKLTKHFNSELMSPVGFHGNKRAGALQLCSRFLGVSEKTGDYSVNLKDCAHFLVNKDIVLHGVCLFGNENSEYEVTLSVEETHGHENVVSKSGKFSSVLKHRRNMPYYGLVVMFDPVILRRNTDYSMNVKMSGPRLCTGVCGAQSVTSHDVRFTFRGCPDSSYCGVYFKHSEQFADILFKLL